MNSLFKKAALPAAIATILTPTAWSEDDSAGLEEVVVTAQKREQNLQDVPVAITAINAEQLTDRKIDDISDVGSTAPNVQIAPSPGGSTGATVAIRGAASINPAATWEPSVGIYMDGVFIAKNVGGIFDVAELSAIEILRGPQGTLYGKNTTGGALNLVTRKPYEEFGAKIKVGAGNYGYTEWGGTVDSGMLGDKVSLMASYTKRDRDGFYDNDAPNAKINEFKKLDSQAGLIKASFDATDSLNLTYTFDFAERDSTVALGQAENLQDDGELPNPKRLGEGALNGAGYDKSDISGHNLITTFDLNEALTLKSITAYREMSFNDQNDYDGSAAPVFETERNVDQNQTSQEFQIIGQFNNVSFVSGLFFFQDEVDVTNPYYWDLNTFGAPLVFVLNNEYGVKSTSYAAFGQVDWLATNQLTLTLGGRYTQEKKDAYINHPDQDPRRLQVNPYSTESDETWTNFSPMAVASYAILDDLTTYVKASQGWRSGGFNGEAAFESEAKMPYEEETTTSYEIGLKGRSLENAIQYNIAIFQNQIKDMQLSNYDQATGYSVIENAGKAEINGLELEINWEVIENLVASLSYGYMDAKYIDFVTNDVDDNGVVLDTKSQKKDTATFAYTPESKAAIAIAYTHDLGFGQLRFNTDYSYTSEQVFYRQPSSSAKTKSPAYGLLNGRIAITDIITTGTQSVDIGLWGKNLTAEAYRLNGIPGFGAENGFSDGINYYGDPRTFGADVTYRF
ncbi:MAG: TonB-dependent receptor [Cellvibrionales bacterium]|nr:TonB-dependent receptor [Cellvibrionales bacterium]